MSAAGAPPTDWLPSVVHVIPHDGIGGVEVAARSMADRGGDGIDFHLVTIAGRSLSSSPAVIESPFESPNNPLAHWRALKIVHRLSPDVLICSLWRSVLVCVVAKLLRPTTRLVFFLHVDRPVHLLDRLLSRLGMLAADEIWADAEETLAGRLRQAKTPVRVVSFVTQRLEPTVPGDVPRPRFVCWARIAPQKGFDRAIELIDLLVERGVDAQLDIYGPDGGALAALERQVEARGLVEHVRFHGSIDHARIGEIAADARFFLQLSRFEGMAIGVVEAMQLGLVPVTTPAGQMARYVGPATGLLVDAAELGPAADRVQALLDDPVAYRRRRTGAIGYWQAAPLYTDDLIRFSRELVAAR